LKLNVGTKISTHTSDFPQHPNTSIFKKEKQFLLVYHGDGLNCFVLGFCFTFILEGAAGFGIPAALGSPILVSLGYDHVPVACATLIMNALQNPFGAVGVGIFFGFANLDEIGEPERLEIGFKVMNSP
jgi:L-lactate permease